MAPAGDIHPVDAAPAAPKLALFGLQHVLIMYAGAVVVPLIVGHGLNLPPDQIALLISADLFACGLATLIQTLGLPGIGVRLPVMMGVTFASVSPILAMATQGAASLPVVYGSVIAAGVFAMLAAPFVGRLSRLFPPVVTGTVILVIGISLMRIGIDWAAGGQPSDPGYGAPLHLGVALFVLAVILALTRFAKGLVNHSAVLIGIVAGCCLSLALGQMSFARVGEARWFALVMPFQFGVPRFSPLPALTMCLVMVVVMIESFGLFLAIGEMVGRPPTERDITRGMRGDALGAILGGVFNTFPYTSFSQNVGLVAVTGVRSRFVCAAGGVILLLLGLSPKLGAVVEAVPSFVLGGAGIVMFGMIAATGVRILTKAEFRGERRNNLIVVGASVTLGMIPMVSDKFFQFFPAALSPLLGSSVLLGTISAVLLNAYYNGLGRKP